MKTLEVLLVDDDVVDVMNVRRELGKAAGPIELTVAHDGLEGLALLRGAPARQRVLLLDLNMPRMNGLEMLRELRRDPVLGGTRVIVLTTSNEDRDRMAAHGLSVDGYLLKPITAQAFELLLARISSARL
jgi:CheY-like chemotaxis protein